MDLYLIFACIKAFISSVLIQNNNTRCFWVRWSFHIMSCLLEHCWYNSKQIYMYHKLTAGKSGILSPGECLSAISKAHARPKITKSNRELAPRRLAPWTEAHAVSPAAYNPSIKTSSPLRWSRTLKMKINN